MERKKYITPAIETIFVESSSIMAASGGSGVSDMEKGNDPFSSPSQSSLGTSEYFNVWEDTEDVAEI